MLPVWKSQDAEKDEPLTPELFENSGGGIMIFSMKGPPKNIGNCSCEDLKHGNGPRFKTNLSLSLAAAIVGWDSYCTIKDYDELAKEETAKEGSCPVSLY